MQQFESIFFENHPDPMWIYDLESLRFLKVNNAALQKYGYSRDEFLGMTLLDIRPPDDLPSLKENVAAVTKGRDEAGIWRHLLKSGEVIYVDITGHTIEYGDRHAELISARDVSRLIHAEHAAKDAASREKAARQASETLARQFQALFDSVPGMFLVLAPENYEVIAVSNAYLSSARVRRNDLLGQNFFDVAPNQPEDDNYEDIRETLHSVVKTGKPSIIDVRSFLVPAPDVKSGFQQRYWGISVSPVAGPDGALLHLMLRVDDLTEAWAEDKPDHSIAGGTVAKRSAADLLSHTLDLKSDNLRLKELVTRLRTAQKMLGFGYWDYLVSEDRLSWSHNVYDLYGVNAEKFGHAFEDYAALVHSEDRERMRDKFARFMDSGDQEFQFAHAIERPDGRVVHVHGVAERIETASGTLLSGVVQDVTQSVELTRDLARSKRLLEIAGTSANFGAWRYDIANNRLEWSSQTAQIHDEPEDFSPSVAEGIAYYAPEHRERIKEVFGRCVEIGEPFDEVLQITTAKNRRLWVRSTGEPEFSEAGEIIAVQGSFQDISELISAQERADELGSRLAETLENIGDAFFTIDRDWRFTYLNSRSETLLKKTRNGLIGHSIFEAFPEFFSTESELQFVRAMETGDTVRFEQECLPLDSLFRIHAHPTRDGLAVYFTDITEDRKRNEQLRLLNAAVSNLNDIVLITETGTANSPDQHKIVYVNDAFETRTGYSREEAIGQTPHILQGPKTNRTELDRIRRALQQWRPVRSELVNYTKDGTEFWLDLEIVPVFDEDNNQTHWVAVERDITERKRSEEALRLSEERFRLIARATNDVIWDWDIKESSIWWNETIEKVFGYEAHSRPVSVDSWRENIVHEDRDRVIESLHSSVSGSKNHWIEEYRFKHADGSVRQVIDRGFIMRDETGTAVRMIGSMLDVTDQREIDQRLHQARKLDAIGQLTGGVAHDFNNILTIIMGNTELLVERLSAHPDLSALAEATERAAMRGAEMTNRLLAFARKQPLRPRAINANEVIGEIQKLLLRTLSETINIEFIPGRNIWTPEVDPNQLETTILNLSINARDAMPDGGYITIETANAVLDDDYAEQHAEVKPGDYVVVSVSDTGFGMTPGIREKAFEPFFTTKETGKGSGLGLSMVYGFVKQSRGHAKIYSEPDNGTTVRLYFPRSNDNAQVIKTDATDQETVGGTEHILIVEDEPELLEHVKGVLQSLGYRTSSAENGPAAIQIIKRTPSIDLLFTDVVMPHGMGGRELADIASVLRPDLPVLFTSGYTENSIVHHGRLDEGCELLEKPYRRQELAAKIRKILDDSG